MKPGARVDSDNYAKEDARDFVLWKAAKQGEPTWDLVDPPGRPGWHLECSAMALRLLGEPPIDIHAGGIDLIFPHHENEIAQSEAATGKPFSRFWMHVEYLLVDDQKMSKSLGNTYTIPDIVARGSRPSAVRYLLLSAHYRKQLNFTWASLGQAEESLRRLTDFLARVDRVTQAGSASRDRRCASTRRRKAFADGDEGRSEHGRRARGDLRARWRAEFCHRSGRGRRRTTSPIIRSAFDEFDRVLGVISLRRAEDERPPVPVEEIERLIEDRHARAPPARLRRSRPDPDELAARGVLLEDHAGGTRWKRK